MFLQSIMRGLYISCIVLRSFSVRSPFVLRSFSVRSPFILRSISVRAPFPDRRTNGERSEDQRKTKRDVTTTHRCGNEGTAKHQQETNDTETNQFIIFYHFKSNYYGKTQWKSCRKLMFKTNAKRNLDLQLRCCLG